VQLAVEPIGLGPMVVLGGDQPAPARNTVGVPLVVALLRSIRGRPITSAETAAVTDVVDNLAPGSMSALEALLGGPSLADRDVQAVLRLGGDKAAVSISGSGTAAIEAIEWSPSDSARFVRSLAQGCVLPPGDTRLVLSLMASLTTSGRWGLASGGFRVPVFIADGWGSAAGTYIVRQIGLVGAGGSAVAVSMTAELPPKGSPLTGGEDVLTRLAGWLRGELDSRPVRLTSCGQQ
jgi:hypothetical protein